MTSNRHPTASSTAQHIHTGNAASLPQSPCGAPSSARRNGAVDVGVENIHDAMEMMSVKEGVAVQSDSAAIESSAKENVRPNSSGRRKWRKNIDQKQRRAAAAMADEGTAAAEVGAIEDGGSGGGGQPKNSAVRKPKSKKHPLKNKKAVVVEISSQETPSAVAAHSPILPPSMDYAGADGASSLSTGNGNSSPGSNHGRFKKSRHQKNQKYSHRHKIKATKGDLTNDVVYANSEFSTNAGGASVITLLGQYPYGAAGPPAAEVFYEGSSFPNSQAITSADGGYYAHIPPNAGTSPGGVIPTAYAGQQHTYHQGAHYPYAAPDAQHHGAAVMGYYVPVMMHNGVVYYNQLAGPAEYPVYYPPFAQYGSAVEPLAPHRHAAGKALNIDAPAFNPKEKQGE